MSNMHTKIGPGTCEWLLSDNPATVEDTNCPKSQRLIHPIPKELGNAYSDQLDLSLGISNVRSVYDFSGAQKHLIKVFEASMPQLEHNFVWFHTVISGGTFHRDWFGEENVIETIGKPGVVTIRRFDQIKIEASVEGGCITEARMAYLSEPTLQTLIGESESEQLLGQLGFNEKTNLVAQQLPAYIRSPWLKAMSEEFEGSARNLFSQACMLEFLAMLCKFVSTDTNDRNPKDNKLAHSVFDFLSSLQGKLPTLGELSQTFNAPANRLNEVFKNEYGQSIFNYMTNHRLIQAHAALLESDIAMKILASRLGYSHVNHFITAFKAKFGYSPGSIRKPSKDI